ncbi:MAG: glycosyl hydrolase-related protein [Oscillospiraceae bacterium]|jgi:hypothetical protein|nr:glycosyl hydrolase-related protein [Oscillospiraceae bacterium]
MEANLKKQWTVYFTPLCHHDYGYTKPIEPLLADYLQFYRDVLRFIEETDGYPEEAKYRYTCEEVWSVHNFLTHCTAEEKDRFLRYAREGRIEVSAFWGNIADTQLSSEALIRTVYDAFALKREYGIPITGASLVDMPGMGWGVPKLMAGAGLTYLFNGMPAYFHWDKHGSVPVHEFWDETQILRHGRPDAYMWEGQDSGKVFTYYQGSYGWMLGAMGGRTSKPDTYEDAEEFLPGLLRAAEAQGVPFSMLRYVDHGEDNVPPKKSISDIVRRWNAAHDNPKLVVATNAQFFTKLKAECGTVGQEPGTLRTFRGEIPHTDYTYAAHSFAKELGLNGRNRHAVLRAEALAALASLYLDAPRQAAAIAAVYRDILTFDEHCFGMWFPIGAMEDYDWSSKAHHAYRAAYQAEQIAARAASALATSAADQHAYVTVFNTQATPRSDTVCLRPLPWEENCTLTDTESGAEIPYTVYRNTGSGDTAEHAAEAEVCAHMGKPESAFAQTLVFRAEGVPPLGWKRYRVTRAAAACAQAPTAGCADALENEYYRIRFAADGQIRSVYDKSLRREWTDSASPYPFAAVLCRECESTQVTLPLYQGYEIVHSDSVMQKAIVRFTAKGLPEAALGIILYAGTPRIELEVKLLLNGLPSHEWLLALPFDLPQPTFSYEGSLCRPTVFRDGLPGTLTNHYCVQNWARAANAESAVAVASPEAHNVYFGGLWPCYVSQAHHAIHPRDFGAPFVSAADVQTGGMFYLLAYNNGRVNFHMTQNGLLHFAFAVASGPADFDPTAFGEGFQNPMTAVYTAEKPERIPAGSADPAIVSGLPENIRLGAFKTAEDGRGFLLRLHESAGKQTETALRLPQNTAHANLTNLAEEDGEPCAIDADRAVQLSFAAFETKSIRFGS